MDILTVQAFYLVIGYFEFEKGLELVSMYAVRILDGYAFLVYLTPHVVPHAVQDVFNFFNRALPPS